MREKLSNQYIKGSGIEIGGLHNPLPVPRGTRVSYVDRAPLEILKQWSPDLPVVENEIIVDQAETLSKIESESQDFLIANHVFEHLEDPILGLTHWLRVVKPGGTLFIAIPDKRQTFDRHRAITPFLHLYRDHTFGVEGSRMNHYIDWFTNSEHERLIDPQERQRRIDLAFKDVSNIHFHVWDEQAIRQMFYEFSYLFPYIESYEIYPNGAEVIVIIKRGVFF